MLESKQQRSATPENSHQSHEQVNKGKKERTQDLTRYDNLPTSSGQKGREFLLNQSLQTINIGDNTSLYIAKEVMKKRKPKTRIRIRNEF